MNVVCIIPARGGSKGVPKKNINEKLYGANPKIVKTPNKKGAKNTTTNLLLIIKVTFQIFIFNWLNLKKNFRFFSF